MAQAYILLLLLLWDKVELSLTNQVCSQLPTLEHGFVSDEYKKVQYQEGDVIYFSCDPGYTTGFNVSYICTENGWKATTNGQCYEKGIFPLLLGCLPPPALKNGQILHFNYFYVDGDMATFQCDPQYKMTGGPFKTCSHGQWTGDLQCEEISCELPVARSEDPVYRTPVGTKITVQCERGGSSKQMECLPSGLWNSTLCPEPCTVHIDQMTSNQLLFPLSGLNKLYVRPGDFFTFQCVPGASHDGAVEMRQRCINGEITLPRCALFSISFRIDGQNIGISIPAE